RAMPAIDAPQATVVRASTSRPSRKAGKSPRATAAAACRLTASVKGVARRLVYDSTACTKASMPLKAVTRGGHERVSSGSTRAAAASQLQSRKLFFTLVSSSVNTALGVISAPAPAVVGTPTHGKGRGGSGAWPLKCRATGCSEKNKPAAALAVSSALPPPTP